MKQQSPLHGENKSKTRLTLKSAYKLDTTYKHIIRYVLAKPFIVPFIRDIRAFSKARFIFPAINGLVFHQHVLSFFRSDQLSRSIGLKPRFYDIQFRPVNQNLLAIFNTLFQYVRMLFFLPRLNILIFLPILGCKYSCVILKLNLGHTAHGTVFSIGHLA